MEEPLMIRLTPNQQDPKDISYMYNILKSQFSQSKFVISREELPKNIHYHLVLWTAFSREKLRAQLKKLFNGFKEISLKQDRVNSPVRAVAYTIKEGNYRLNLLTLQELTEAKKVSFEKPKSLTQIYGFIKEEYFNDQITFKETVTRVIEVERTSLNLHTIECMLTEWKKQKDSNYKNSLVRTLLSRLDEKF